MLTRQVRIADQITFTFMHLTDAFYPKRLTGAFRLYIFLFSMCFKINPQILADLSFKNNTYTATYDTYTLFYK